MQAALICSRTEDLDFSTGSSLGAQYHYVAPDVADVSLGRSGGASYLRE